MKMNKLIIALLMLACAGTGYAMDPASERGRLKQEKLALEKRLTSLYLGTEELSQNQQIAAEGLSLEIARLEREINRLAPPATPPPAPARTGLGEERQERMSEEEFAAWLAAQAADLPATTTTGGAGTAAIDPAELDQQIATNSRQLHGIARDINATLARHGLTQARIAELPDASFRRINTLLEEQRDINENQEQLIRQKSIILAGEEKPYYAGDSLVDMLNYNGIQFNRNGHIQTPDSVQALNNPFTHYVSAQQIGHECGFFALAQARAFEESAGVPTAQELRVMVEPIIDEMNEQGILTCPATMDEQAEIIQLLEVSNRIPALRNPFEDNPNFFIVERPEGIEIGQFAQAVANNNKVHFIIRKRTHFVYLGVINGRMYYLDSMNAHIEDSSAIVPILQAIDESITQAQALGAPAAPATITRVRRQPPRVPRETRPRPQRRRRTAQAVAQPPVVAPVVVPAPAQEVDPSELSFAERMRMFQQNQ